MQCMERTVCFLSWGMIIGGVLYLLRQLKAQNTQYGRYVEACAPGVMVPAKTAWFIQELPSVLVPALLLLYTDTPHSLGHSVLVWTFCLHYVHRTFIYALLNRGQPCPLLIVVSAAVFCSLNGFLQGHYMLHCAQFDADWHTDVRFVAGLLVFIAGMAINIHSDHILRNLRKPGETTYKIPEGGMFEWVSGANFFGEIIEWCGYATATWSLPTFSFAFFTICSIGPRAYQHHRFYLEKFNNYPKSRKAVIPFIL